MVRHEKLVRAHPPSIETVGCANHWQFTPPSPPHIRLAHSLSRYQFDDCRNQHSIQSRKKEFDHLLISALCQQSRPAMLRSPLDSLVDLLTIAIHRKISLFYWSNKTYSLVDSFANTFFVLKTSNPFLSILPNLRSGKCRGSFFIQFQCM